MNKSMIKIESVSKEYRLGQIGGTTLRDELQRKQTKILKKEDPTRKIGVNYENTNQKFLALDSISFAVNKGERVGIIGHNGAGKSTLLKLLSRVTAPTKGKICLNGRVASMLEVGTGFHPELTGRENIYMNGAILGMTKKEIDAKIDDIIDFSECRQFIDTPVKRYSSGMYVKLAFSVAAHLDSEIMIMDEVLAVGDMAFQKKCLDKMKSVSNEDSRTILYVSHNMGTIRTLCDRCIVLEHGKLIFDGDVEEAIGIYLNSNQNSDYIIDYTDYKRASWVDRDIIRIDSIKNIPLNDAPPFVFEQKEKLKLQVNYHSKEKIDKIACRFEVRDELDAPIASSNSYNVLISEGEGSFYVVYDFSSLAVGKYRGVFVFNQLQSSGEYIIDDWVNQITFEIVDTYSKGKLNWNRRNFGCFILPDGIVE